MMFMFRFTKSTVQTMHSSRCNERYRNKFCLYVLQKSVSAVEKDQERLLFCSVNAKLKLVMEVE